MSLWYDKNKKSYASNGHGSWIKLYAEHLFDVLKEEIFSKFAGHYSGNEGKHQAEDVLYDNSTVKKEIDALHNESSVTNNRIDALNNASSVTNNRIDALNQEISNERQNNTAMLSQKVDKISGMGLSQNSFSNAEKSKLAGIETGAEVNLVKSVAGRTGVVTLSKTDVGLDKVNNTADTDKPVSKAVQNALKSKEDKPTIIDLTEHNLTIEDILKGNYLDNLFEGNYIIKYGFIKIEDQIDYSEYNYATLRVLNEFSDIDARNARYLQEISFSVANRNTNKRDFCYIQQKYTRIYSYFNDGLYWSDWKKDISYQEINCGEDLLTTNLLDNCFSLDGQLERYVIRDPRNNQIWGELTVFFTGTPDEYLNEPEFRFYTQILEIFGNNNFYGSACCISRYTRTYGGYEYDNDNSVHLVKAWSEWTPADQNIVSYSADKKNLALSNNREYFLDGTTNLTITFPTGNFESWLSVTFADTGAVSLTFPDDARYIGYAPQPTNGETWEISVKNGVVVGAKVGGGNE